MEPPKPPGPETVIRIPYGDVLTLYKQMGLTTEQKRWRLKLRGVDDPLTVKLDARIPVTISEYSHMYKTHYRDEETGKMKAEAKGPFHKDMALRSIYNIFNLTEDQMNMPLPDYAMMDPISLERIKTHDTANFPEWQWDPGRRAERAANQGRRVKATTQGELVAEVNLMLAHFALNKHALDAAWDQANLTLTDRLPGLIGEAMTGEDNTANAMLSDASGPPPIVSPEARRLAEKTWIIRSKLASAKGSGSRTGIGMSTTTGLMEMAGDGATDALLGGAALGVAGLALAKARELFGDDKDTALHNTGFIQWAMRTVGLDAPDDPKRFVETPKGKELIASLSTQVDRDSKTLSDNLRRQGIIVESEQIADAFQGVFKAGAAGYAGAEMILEADVTTEEWIQGLQTIRKTGTKEEKAAIVRFEKLPARLKKLFRRPEYGSVTEWAMSNLPGESYEHIPGTKRIRGEDITIQHEKYGRLTRGWMNEVQAHKRNMDFDDRVVEEAREIASGLAGAVQLFMSQTEGVDRLAALVASGEIDMEDAEYKAFLQGYKKGTPMFGGLAAYFAPFADSPGAVIDQAIAQPIDTMLNFLPFYFAMRGLGAAHRGYRAAKDIDRLVDAGLSDKATATRAAEIGEQLLDAEQKPMLRRWLETADGKLFNGMLESAGISSAGSVVPEALTGAMRGAILGTAFGIPGDPAFYAMALGGMGAAGKMIKKSPFMMRLLESTSASNSAAGQRLSEGAMSDLEALAGVQSELVLQIEHSTRGGVARYIPLNERTATSKAAELGALAERGLVRVDSVVDHAAAFQAMVSADPAVVAARATLSDTPFHSPATQLDNAAYRLARQNYDRARAEATIRLAKTLENETGSLLVPHAEETFASEVNVIMRERELASKANRDAEAALRRQYDTELNALRERGKTAGGAQLETATERLGKGKERLVAENRRNNKNRERELKQAERQNNASLRELELQRDALKAPIKAEISKAETALRNAKKNASKAEAKAKAAYKKELAAVREKRIEVNNKETRDLKTLSDQTRSKLDRAKTKPVAKRNEIRAKARLKRDSIRARKKQSLESRGLDETVVTKRRDKAISRAAGDVKRASSRVDRLKQKNRDVRVRIKGKRKSWAQINREHAVELNRRNSDIEARWASRRDDILRNKADLEMDVRVAQARVNRAVNDQLFDVDAATEAVLPTRAELPSSEQVAAQAAKKAHDDVISELRSADKLDQADTRRVLDDIIKARAAEYERAINSAFGVFVDDGNYVLRIRETLRWDPVNKSFIGVESKGSSVLEIDDKTVTGRPGIVELSDTPIGTAILGGMNLAPEDLPKVFAILTRYVDDVVDLIESLGDIDSARRFLAGTQKESVRGALKAKRPRIREKDGKVSVEFASTEKWAENVIDSVGSRLTGSSRNFAKRLLLDVYGELLMNQQSRTLLLDNALRERFVRYASEQLTQHLGISKKAGDIGDKVGPLALSFANGRTFGKGTSFGRVTHEFLDIDGNPIFYTRPNGEKATLGMDNLFSDFMTASKTKPKELARIRSQAFSTAITVMSYGAEQRLVADAVFRSLGITDEIWSAGSVSAAYRQSVYEHYVRNGTLPEAYRNTVDRSTGTSNLHFGDSSPLGAENELLLRSALERNPESGMSYSQALDGIVSDLDDAGNWVALGQDKSGLAVLGGKIGEGRGPTRTTGIVDVHAPLQPEHIGGPQQRLTQPNVTRAAMDDTVEGQQLLPLGKSADTVYINKDTSGALGWALGTNPDDLARTDKAVFSFLVSLNTTWKWGRTAGSFVLQNPATNFTSNVVTGMISQGTDPVNAWRGSMQAGWMWERYAAGALDGTHAGLQVDALVRTGFKNQAQLIAEIDTIRQALHANGGATALGTSIDDLVRGGKINIPKGMQAKLGRKSVTIESYRDLTEFQDYLYKTFGDELHKLNDAMIQMNKNEALIGNLPVNRGISFSNLDSGGGFGSAPPIGTIIKTEKGYTIIRSTGRKKGKPIHVDSLEAPEAMDLLANASMGHANSLYYNLSNVGVGLKQARTLEALMMSPFLSWMFKALDLPMIKKGMFYRMFVDDIYQITTDPLVNLSIYSEAAARAARRALTITAIKDQEFDSGAVRAVLPTWAASAIIAGDPERDIKFYFADSSMPISGFIGFLEFMSEANSRYHGGERQLVDAWQYTDETGKDNVAYTKDMVPKRFRESATRTRVVETIKEDKFWTHSSLDPERSSQWAEAGKRLFGGGLTSRLAPIFGMNPLTMRSYPKTESGQRQRREHIASMAFPNLAIYPFQVQRRYEEEMRAILRWEPGSTKAYTSMRNAGDRTMTWINSSLARRHRKLNPIWLAKFGATMLKSAPKRLAAIVTKDVPSGKLTENDARREILMFGETARAYGRWLPRFAAMYRRRAEQVALYDPDKSTEMMGEYNELMTAHLKGVPALEEAIKETGDAGYYDEEWTGE